jgi:hypothetical protein
LPTALSFSQQFPTKLHISPLAPTIDKKNGRCKPFFVIFPLQDNDLARFCYKNKFLKKQYSRELSESDLLELVGM